MAEEQSIEQPAHQNTAKTIQEHNTKDVLITQIKDTENSEVQNGRTAGENYHDIASTVFEAPKISEEAETDNVPIHMNKESADKPDLFKEGNTNIMENNKEKGTKTDEQTLPDEPSKEANGQQVESEETVKLTPAIVTAEQVDAEDGVTSDNDAKEMEQAIDIQNTNEQETGGPNVNSNLSGQNENSDKVDEHSAQTQPTFADDDNKEQVNDAAVDDTPAVNSDTVAAVDSVTAVNDIAVVGTAVAVDNNIKLSEDDIIQRLHEVNQQVYTDDDKTTHEHKQPDTNVQADDSTKDPTLDADNTNEVEPSGDGDASDVVKEDDIISARAGGDNGPVPDESNIEVDEELNNNTDPTAPLSEIMSEDLDAMPVSDLYRTYTRKGEQEADMSENEAAISEIEQQQHRPHVKYADLPNLKGALSDSSQVCVSKRSHAQVAHQCRGPSRVPPQTAPSISSMHSTTKSVQIPRIPSPPASDKSASLVNERKHAARSPHKLPPSLMRMSTVMVSARKRAILNRQASVYFEERKTSKVVTLDQCINSRPPLPFDLDGPGPWQYSPRNQPLYETNAPQYSMGCKFYERDGGGRTAWAKTWFNSPDNFTRKVRWEKSWPSPANYSSRSPLLGRPRATWKSYPQFSIGVRTNFSINKRGSENEPAPCQYNRDKADHLVMRSAPSFSMGQRHQATTLGKIIESTPSPTAYKPAFKHMSSHVHYPSFTIRGVRKQKIHALGPHSTL